MVPKRGLVDELFHECRNFLFYSKYIEVNICTYKVKGWVMLELGISQAQNQFTKLLNQTVLIVDKKAHIKKAVILPYEEYIRLINSVKSKKDLSEGVFNKFAGILNSDFKIDDEKYNRIIG